MTTNGFLQIIIYFLLIVGITKPLGGYMTRVFSGERTLFSPLLLPLERLLYRLAGVDEKREQDWKSYGIAMLMFALAGFVSLYLLQRIQSWLPFNPQGMGDIAPDLAFNTSVSFITNTNWQAYSGETTMSYFIQMVGLTVHNFLSAATGIALALALVRGFARHSSKTIGNYWVDLTRCVLYILIPISSAAAIFLVWQGIPQNLNPYTDVTTLEGARQTLAQGPVASQIAIKMLGTNGGGFFNANAAHPYENPTALSNLVQMVLILACGAALTNVFGRMVGNSRQGWALFCAMAFLFLVGVTALYAFESVGNPALTALGIDQSASDIQSGGNMEGKEVRFGIINSALFATATTDASCGAVNGMHDSFTPLGGIIPLVNMELGELIFGGVGSGLYGILLFAILTMFVAGLMIGRTPEYVGKKLESHEIKMTMLALLVLPFSMLGFTALALSVSPGLAGIANNGPHGFSEILYAYTSATANNGSAFAGLNANSLFYNVTIGIAMIIGRFAMIVPMLALAGSLAGKKSIQPSPGTFPTDNIVFVALLVIVIVIIGGLTFFPALALGPIVEHTLMQGGKLF